MPYLSLKRKLDRPNGVVGEALPLLRSLHKANDEDLLRRVLHIVAEKRNDEGGKDDADDRAEHRPYPAKSRHRREVAVADSRDRNERRVEGVRPVPLAETEATLKKATAVRMKGRDIAGARDDDVALRNGFAADELLSLRDLHDIAILGGEGER